MDTNIYKSFVAVVESGTLSKAASILHIAQPALTRHMKILQEKYNTPLLMTKQGQRSIELTPAGKILYEKAKYLITLENQIAEDIQSDTQGIGGTLRFTTSPSVAYNLIAATLSNYHEKYPNVSFELFETSTEEQSENLLNGVAEIGIANAPVIRPDLFNIHLTEEDRMAVFVHQKSPVLKDCTLIPDSFQNTGMFHLPLPEIYRILSSLPICLTKGCHDADLKFCAELGLSVRPLCISTTVTAALQWAKENKAAVIAPVNLDKSIPEGLIAFLLPSNCISNFRSVYTVKGRKLSLMAEHFLQMLPTPENCGPSA